MGSARVVAMLGACQAGKSTLARMFTTRPELAAEYVTLDDEPVRALALGDPTGFVAGLGRPTVIDEAQRAPDLLLAIKARVDRDTSAGQFLLTGSANLRRIPTVSDALPGRIDYLTPWPFTQGELRGEPENLLGRLFAGHIPTISDAPTGRHQYLEQLLAGGFPEAQSPADASRRRFFDSATVRPSDFRGLLHMRERLGERLVAGVVLYAGERTLPFGERLWAVPLCALWE